MKHHILGFVLAFAAISYGFTYTDSTFSLVVSDSFAIEDSTRPGYFVYKNQESKNLYARLDIKSRKSTSFDFNVNYCKMNLEGFQSEANAKGITYQLLADSANQISGKNGHRIEYVIQDKKILLQIIQHGNGAVLITMSAYIGSIGSVGANNAFENMVQSFQEIN